MSVSCFVSWSRKWTSEVVVAQPCPALCDPMVCGPPGSSVHGILQARILEWVAIAYSRGSSRPWDRTWVSLTAGRFFTVWTTSGPKINQSLFLQMPYHLFPISEIQFLFHEECWITIPVLYKWYFLRPKVSSSVFLHFI